MLTIEEFCDKHKACKEGRDWALANCSSMIDAWGKLPPEWLVWVATRRGVLTDKELRLFVMYCARSVEHLLTDQRSRDAIDVAERFANGEATDDELEAAWEAAWAALAAARPASRAADDAAAWESRSSRAARPASRAAWEAAWAAWAADAESAWLAAWAASRASADASADAAADAASYAASRAASRAAQADWLRANTRPSFE